MGGGIKVGSGFGLWRLGMPSPETICSLAERAEDVGLDSIWLSDHIVAGGAFRRGHGREMLGEDPQVRRGRLPEVRPLADRTTGELVAQITRWGREILPQLETVPSQGG